MLERGRDRSDWWIAVGIAALLHAVLIIFLVKGTRREPPAQTAPPAAAEETYRDIPAAPAGITVDTLPFEGLRGSTEGHPIIVECEYQLRTDSLLRLSGPARAAGVLGCDERLSAAAAFAGAHIRIHYNVDGQLLGIMGYEEPSRLIESVQSWRLADPRPGRQWQGSVIFDLTIR